MTCSATLRTYVVGGASLYWMVTNVTGLDDVVVKYADTDQHFANGVTASRDYLAATPVIIDVQTIRGLAPASVGTALSGLRTAWLPSTVDLTLTVVANGTTYNITGRPRGMTVDRRLASVGVVRAQLTFLDTK